jgi:hypothetical protein
MYLLCGGLLVLFLLGCVLIVQRDNLLVAYHVRNVVRSSDPAVSSAEWLKSRTMLSLPQLLAQLTSPEPAVCERSASLVREIVQECKDPTNPEDSHLTLALAAKLNQAYERLSPDGRGQAVLIAIDVLHIHLSGWSPNVPTVLENGGDVLLSALVDESPTVKSRALSAAKRIWDWDGTDRVSQALVRDWQRQCYLRSVELLGSDKEEIRAAAADAIARSKFHEGDAVLISKLKDKSVRVRKAVLVALSHGAGDALDSDEKESLMTFLSDPDAEVRSAAAQLLRSAGISEAKVRLASLMRNPDPMMRAKAPEEAFAISNLDAVSIVLELADDEAPAVRVAVARTASTSDRPELREILQKMADADPDPLVRDMAKQFLAMRLVNRK